MMDTGAIYLEVCNYGRACRAGNIMDEADHMQMIASLLRNADEEHKALLADNERLVDEVGSLKAARIAYASEFPPIPDGDDAGLPAVGCIHENIRRLKAELERIKALEPVAWRSSMGHGVTLKETTTDEQRALVWDGKPMWQPLYALWSKT